MVEFYNPAAYISGMKRSAAQRLQHFYEQFAGDDRVLILINADPDAIASAMAVKRLLWRKTASVTIGTINVVKRPDNIAMLERLRVNLIHVVQLDPTRFTRRVIVDSQPDHSPDFARFEPFHVVIDHHPQTAVTAPFLDIRPAYGATATILTEYLRTAKIKPSARLATGLFHAIKTDTSNFERKSLIEDVRAFQFLFRHANIQLARKIEQSDLTLGFLKYFVNALQNMRMHTDRVFVHLGNVVNPDVCVLIADFFMRVNNVNWTVISGIHDKKLVVILRNDGLRNDAGKLAKRAFGALGSAGGHKTMARAEIPVATLAEQVDHKSNRKLMSWIIARIEKRAPTKGGMVEKL